MSKKKSQMNNKKTFLMHPRDRNNFIDPQTIVGAGLDVVEMIQDMNSDFDAVPVKSPQGAALRNGYSPMNFSSMMVHESDIREFIWYNPWIKIGSETFNLGYCADRETALDELSYYVNLE